MIYFDNSATSPIDEEVLDAMLPYLKEEYGNPSSKYYCKSINAKNAVEEARHNIAKLIGAKDEEIIFTAGASESTNFIIKGYMDYRRYYLDGKNHIITSRGEHKATLNTCKFLAGQLYSNNDATVGLFGAKASVDRGYEVTFTPISNTGEIKVSEIESSIKDTTAMVSCIYVNNEVGTKSDIKSISQLCKGKNIVVHSDLTQAVGKIKVDINELGINFASFSAHKLYGPKGIGAAVLKSDTYGIPPITSLIHGGEQEFGVRAGTLAVHDIVGFGKAAEIAVRDFEKNTNHLLELDNYTIQKLKSIQEVALCNPTESRLPGMISIIIDKQNFHNERFVKRVSEKIAISTGSACSAGEPSHVITAMGMEASVTKVIRITLNKFTQKEDIDQLITIINGNI